MPCSDSSSSIDIRLDHDERFVAFDFAKITCGREITAKTGYSAYCAGKSLEEILKVPYLTAVNDLRLKDEESQFILHLEWEALRSAIVQYLGIEAEGVDVGRCRITSIAHTETGIEIALVILPPKDLPKILPCSMGQI